MTSRVGVLLGGVLSIALSAHGYKVATAVHATAIPCNNGTWACGRATLKANADEYARMARTAAEEGADIIVFPEDGLAGLWDSYSKYDYFRMGYADSFPEVPARRTVPCNDAQSATFRHAPTVVRLSCIAQQEKIAVVANLLDWDSSDGKLYNTDVVFDTDGTWLSKYHKLNLWGEQDYIDVPTDCPEVIFTTSFNVTFGLLTCADLIYKFPVLDMVSKGVKDFLMLAGWDNGYAQMQVMAYAQGWSLANNVNLVLSNLQWDHPGGTTSSGSGVWSAGVPLAYHYAVEDKGAAPLIVEIPKPGVGRRLQAADASGSWERFNITKFGAQTDWVFAPLSRGRLCTRSICCEAAVTSGKSAGYTLAALDGKDVGGDSTWRTQSCAVLPCPTPGYDCLWYQEPGWDTDLTGLSLSMSGVASESVIPEVIAMGQGDHYQKILPPGVGLEHLKFESSVSKAQLSLRTSTWLLSALIYGRPFTEPLPYSCPERGGQRMVYV